MSDYRGQANILPLLFGCQKAIFVLSLPRFALAVLFLMLSVSVIRAQDAGADLVVTESEIVTRRDVFGTEQPVLEGVLTNKGAVAYTGINLFADVYNTEGEVFGEGFGFVVDACGTALLDFVLQPGVAQAFALTLELFDEAALDRVEVFPQASAADPDMTPPPVYNGVSQVTDREVVAVEWIDGEFLRYAVGCPGAVFTAFDWYEYDRIERTEVAISHPRADLVTEGFIEQSGINIVSQGGGINAALFDDSYLVFPPNARRAVFQTDLNTIMTVEPDGTFRRMVHDALHTYTLRGITWLPEGRFMPYFFGGYGEPVHYFTASVDGQQVSGAITASTPSVIVPGPTPDGRAVVIGATFDGVTGYYLQSIAFADAQLLFEAELPGNNWPAPLFQHRADDRRFVYLARPVDSVPRLQCFDIQESRLDDLTPLPLQLNTDERAWMWLSPDENTIALAANGVNGGLWLVNLSGFMACP